MSNISRVIDEVILEAEQQRDRAYKILGAKPGPGTDVTIRPPIEAVNGMWIVEGLTLAGKNFVSKLWFDQPLTNHQLRQLKSECIDWGLKYQITYPVSSLED